jgi:hypothetical protein
LQEIETDLAAMRHEERQHVRTLERAGRRVQAILTLFRTMERRRARLLSPPSAPMPAPEQIRRFLQAFEILGRFDIEQRSIRGYGAGFDQQEWPVRPNPDVVVVRTWLEEPIKLIAAGCGADDLK